VCKIARLRQLWHQLYLVSTCTKCYLTLVANWRTLSLVNSATKKTKSEHSFPARAVRIRRRKQLEKLGDQMSKTQTDEDKLLRLAEAASELRVATFTLRHWCLSGKISYHRIGAQLMLLQSDINEFVRSSRIPAAVEAGEQ
jgi:hypothetical protein